MNATSRSHFASKSCCLPRFNTAVLNIVCFARLTSALCILQFFYSCDVAKTLQSSNASGDAKKQQIFKHSLNECLMYNAPSHLLHCVGHHFENCHGRNFSYFACGNANSRTISWYRRNTTTQTCLLFVYHCCHNSYNNLTDGSAQNVTQK